MIYRMIYIIYDSAAFQMHLGEVERTIPLPAGRGEG
jgi:hypothetical protein